MTNHFDNALCMQIHSESTSFSAAIAGQMLAEVLASNDKLFHLDISYNAIGTEDQLGISGMPQGWRPAKLDDIVDSLVRNADEQWLWLTGIRNG